MRRSVHTPCRCLIAPLAGAIALSSQTSFADESVRFRLDYAAAEGCTDARGFAQAVMARSRRARVGAGSDSTEIVVSVERREVGYAGHLHAAPPSGDVVDRSVRGDHCADVVDALSFIAALALDPDATSTPQPSPERPRPKPREPAPGPSQPGLRWSFGGGGFLTPLTNSVPEAEVGYGLFFQAASDGAVLAPSLLGFVERIPGGTVSRQTGSADFSLLAGGAELCPVRYPARSTLEIRPCAGIWAGTLHAEAHGVVLARQPTRVWLAAFASLRGSWTFVAPFFAFAELGAGVPLVRQRYSFDSGEGVFDTPTLVGFSRIGVGVSFP